MFLISVSATFAASHIIPGYPGICSRLHGHNWTVDITWRTDRLNSLGMALDFHVAESLLTPIVQEVDHSHLNDHPFFKEHSPTSENVAFLFFSRIKEAMNSLENLPSHVRLDQVAVMEMAPYRAIYREAFPG
ncbi:MAG: 6-carboxytetrahydropterin synthase [Leptospirales bacterium]